MPEGNEIHRWAERHARAFVGKKLHVDSPTGRFADADALDGRKLVEVRAKGKHLGYVFGKDRVLHVHLGPDPLDGDDPALAFAAIAKSKMTIAQLLMEQEVIAGIGNIYRAELLYRAKLNPFVEGRAVPLKTLQAIWKDAIPLMRAGMVDRRIVTTRVKDRPHGAGLQETGGKPLKEEVHYVYRRAGKPCWVCDAKVMKQELAGRTLYWCPVCQAG